MPTHYVEVVRPDGTPCQPGEDGDVVVTFLANRSMPLIRYRIGDRAVPADPLEPCPCGRPFPRLMNVVGRALDAFLRADGTWVHGVNVKRFNRWTPWIAQFQVVQLTVDHVLVRLVDRERLVDPVTSRRAGLEAIAAYLRELMGPACRVSFEFLDHIPRAPSGKYRLTMRLGPAACQAEPAATSTGGSGTPRSSGSGTVGAHGI
jgi:phenylacetate-CoA ligase